MKATIKLIWFFLARNVKRIYWVWIDAAYRFGVIDSFDVPIIINNFNRVTYLSKLVDWLEKAGYRNITILDNASTFEPVLEYYRKCPHRVIKLNRNYGHLALWHAGIYDKIKWNYFVYTDPDVVPIEASPGNFVQYFWNTLRRNARLDKIGFGIKIDDLPPEFLLREKVIAYEKRYWQTQICPGFYEAPVDTTLALYKPLSGLKAGHAYTLNAWRADHPFLIHHLPWYTNTRNLTDEERFYQLSSNASSTLANQQVKGEKIY